MIQKNLYKAFGSTILSDINLPELSQLSRHIQYDIIIEQTDLTNLWDELMCFKKNNFVVKDNFVMFKVRDTGIFLVENGQKISFSPLPYADENKIRLYILGTCFGALLLQRKTLPLHGSAVAIEGRAYAIIGERGAGKSTLASALITKGYFLLSDDIIPISLNKDNIPIVIASYPQQKLWEQSLTAFGMDTAKFNPLFERETKYAVPVVDQFQANPLKLGGVFELIKSDTENVILNKVQGLERFPLLYKHTFRSFLIPKLGLSEWHFQYNTRFVNKVNIYQLRRPESRFTALDLADVILNTIRRSE